MVERLLVGEVVELMVSMFSWAVAMTGQESPSSTTAKNMDSIFTDKLCFIKTPFLVVHMLWANELELVWNLDCHGTHLLSIFKLLQYTNLIISYIFAIDNIRSQIL